MKSLIIIVVTIVLCALSSVILFNYPLVLGSLAAWVTTGSFILQVIHIVKNKDTSGLSTGMWAALFFGVTTWSVYGFYLGDFPIMIANGITSIMALAVLGLKIWNERPKNVTNREFRRIPGVIIRLRIKSLTPINQKKMGK